MGPVIYSAPHVQVDSVESKHVYMESTQTEQSVWSSSWKSLCLDFVQTLLSNWVQKKSAQWSSIDWQMLWLWWWRLWNATTYGNIWVLICGCLFCDKCNWPMYPTLLEHGPHTSIITIHISSQEPKIWWDSFTCGSRPLLCITGYSSSKDLAHGLHLYWPTHLCQC